MPNISSISAESKAVFDGYIDLINSELDIYRASEMESCGLQKEVADAMWYTLSAGGKRVRAVLVMEFPLSC